MGLSNYKTDLTTGPDTREPVVKTPYLLFIYWNTEYTLYLCWYHFHPTPCQIMQVLYQSVNLEEMINEVYLWLLWTQIPPFEGTIYLSLYPHTVFHMIQTSLGIITKREDWEWLINFIPHFIMDVYLFMLTLEFNHNSKRSPSTSLMQAVRYIESNNRNKNCYIYAPTRCVSSTSHNLSP